MHTVAAGALTRAAQPTSHVASRGPTAFRIRPGPRTAVGTRVVDACTL